MRGRNAVVAWMGWLIAAPVILAQTEPQPLEPLMTVVGRGEAHGRPDLAVVTVGVVTQASTAAEALSANTGAMRALMEVLQKHEIESRDIQTVRFDVTPQRRHDQRGRAEPEIVGYQVTNQVRVRLRDLQRLGTLLDEMVREGANRVQNVVFAVDDPQPLEDEARRQAVADARRKAELYAEAAGVTLGPTVRIQDQWVGIPRPPEPQFRALAVQEAVPVEPGELTITAQITLTYRLADPEDVQPPSN